MTQVQRPEEATKNQDKKNATTTTWRGRAGVGLVLRASLPIFLSVPFPAVNGITTYSINVARGLARLGYPTRILLTEADTTLATYHERTLEIPADWFGDE